MSQRTVFFGENSFGNRGSCFLKPKVSCPRRKQNKLKYDPKHLLCKKYVQNMNYFRESIDNILSDRSSVDFLNKGRKLYPMYKNSHEKGETLRNVRERISKELICN